MARNRFSRRRAANGTARYLNERQAQAPRNTYDRGGNRRLTKP